MRTRYAPQFFLLILTIAPPKAFANFGCVDQQNFVGGFCDLLNFTFYIDSVNIDIPPIRFILSDAVLAAIAEQQSAAANAAMQAKFQKLDRILESGDFEVGDPDQYRGTNV